jgi:hypothetical protein
MVEIDIDDGISFMDFFDLVMIDLDLSAVLVYV